MDQMRDYNMTPSSDTISSPTITITSSKEVCLSDTNTPESTPTYYAGESLHNTPGTSLQQGGCSRSFSSRSSPPINGHVLSRNTSGNRIDVSSFGNARRLMCAARRSFGSSDCGQESFESTSDWWSMKTFSELVASSRREHPNWINGSSKLDLISSKTSIDLGDSLIEKIKLSSPLASASHGTDILMCGVCSRWLSLTPLSPHKMTASNDLSVVGVLSCGHVFHAECLEQITPEGAAHDPPCPECHALQTSSVRNHSQALVALKSLVNSSQSQSSTRNKLSRIGILTDDMPSEVLSEPSQREEDKVVYPLPGFMEKGSLSRSISRTFSFRGKSIKDETWSDPNTKQKGNQSKATHLKRALKHLVT